MASLQKDKDSKRKRAYEPDDSNVDLIDPEERKRKKLEVSASSTTALLASSGTRDSSRGHFSLRSSGTPLEPQESGTGSGGAMSSNRRAAASSNQLQISLKPH